MKFDLSGETQGEWFKFFRSEVKENGEFAYLEPEDGAGSVCLRIVDPETIENIHSQTRKRVKEFVHNPKTRAMERVEYDEQTPAQKKKENEMVWDHAIQDWKGILDKDGNEIPCTLENKLKLMNVSQFARFVGRCMQIISGSNDRAAEEKVKN